MVNGENHDKPAGESLDQQENPLDEQNQEQAATDAAPVDAAQQEIAELKDKYLRLYSEFDNFRRRTAKERIELMQTAGKEVVLSMLPVLDDFERALKAFGDENAAQKEGVQLIYHKMKRNLEAQGLKEMESNGAVFNPDLHEAITQIPSPTEDLKGKVVDTVEKGYYLQETVVRFAKVVIGN